MSSLTQIHQVISIKKQVLSKMGIESIDISKMTHTQIRNLMRKGVGNKFQVATIEINSLLENQFGSFTLMILNQDDYLTIPYEMNCVEMKKIVTKFLKERVEPDCSICYEATSSNFACSTCMNFICSNCIGKISKCPFCRTPYPIVNHRIISKN